MGLNLAANALIGAIPVFGDIFSIGFRSNAKNAELLERYAGKRSPARQPGGLVLRGRDNFRRRIDRVRNHRVDRLAARVARGSGFLT